MKKFSLVLAMLALALVFGLAFVGCGSNEETPTEGTFTLKDIPSQYNGKYAIFVAFRHTDSRPELWGIQGDDANGNMILTKIENGRVDIPLQSSTAQWGKYTGNHTYEDGLNGGILFISIYEASAIYNLDAPDLATFGVPQVTFTSGGAIVSFKDLEQW
jgi:hypothetical protein